MEGRRRSYFGTTRVVEGRRVPWKAVENVGIFVGISVVRAGYSKQFYLRKVSNAIAPEWATYADDMLRHLCDNLAHPFWVLYLG